jgi:16S rRNA (cytidine1402-2'-O)-methyltransferase
MRKKKEASILYIVSTPIGNEDDISLRALKVLKKVDAIICEEEKIGALLIKRHNFSAQLEQLNEHNEENYAPQLIERMENGETFALISDAGTPIFADPGRFLLQLALDAGVNIVVVPGASSIMTALVRSGFQSDVFTCAGFLSRTTEERLSQLQALALEPRTTILLETPYRLKQLLEAANKVMPDRKAYIGCNLTMAFEHHHYGTFSELFAKFTESPFKGEFVIVFEGHPGRTILSILDTNEKKKPRTSERNNDEVTKLESDESADRPQREFRKRPDFSKERSSRFKSQDGGYKKRDDGGYKKRDAGGYKKRDDGGYKKRDAGGYKKRDDAGGYKKRDDAGGYKKRDDVGGYKKRDDAGGYKKRDDAGGYKKRDDAGGYKKRDDAGGYKKRDDAGGYKKRETGGYKKRDDSGYKKRDDRRSSRNSNDARMRPPRKRS